MQILVQGNAGAELNGVRKLNWSEDISLHLRVIPHSRPFGKASKILLMNIWAFNSNRFFSGPPRRDRGSNTPRRF